MQRRDWALLAISYGEGEPLQPVQLQKSLFLLGERLRLVLGASYYQFQPYNYGPFSREVYDDAERLAADGLVRIDRGRWAEYSATAAGLEEAKRVAQMAPSEAAALLKDIVAWARGLSFQQLVSAIYKEFPAQRQNSVFQE